ncbi:MAG: hypothetical protein WDA07_13610 [Leucobacter sp.]
MSRDFWFGMFAIPAAAVAVAVVAGAAVAFIWYSERFDLSSWKLWPRRPKPYNNAVLPAVVACAKWVRYLWVPGWHIVICRTRLFDAGDTAACDRQRRVQQAVREALSDAASPQPDGEL